MMRRPKGLPDAASRRAHSSITAAMPARFGEQQPAWLIPKEFPSRLPVMSGSKLGVVLPRHATGRPVAHLAREGKPLPLHPTLLPLRGVAGTVRPAIPTRVRRPRPASARRM